jgi:hypothetical protein
MSSDLLFSILPREGKVPIAHDDQKVQKVTKTAKLRTLSDKEEELHHEELEVSEKYQSKKQAKDPKACKDQNAKQPKQNQVLSDEAEQVPDDEDKKGPKHLDIYV